MNSWLARAIIIFTAGTGCILSLHYATSHFRADRQLILLNRTRPDFQNFPNGDFKEYVDYFQLVTQAMPENSDGALMLGYLNEISGHDKQAEILLKESYRLDPQFFFTEFDLALVYFNQGEYSQSADLLQKALAVSPEDTVKHMMNSVIYRQILSSMKDSHDIIVNLQQAYHDAYVLMIESKQKESQGAGVGPKVHAHIM